MNTPMTMIDSLPHIDDAPTMRSDNPALVDRWEMADADEVSDAAKDAARAMHAAIINRRDMCRAQALTAVQESRAHEGRAGSPWTSHDAATAYLIADMLLAAAGIGDHATARPQAALAAVAEGSARALHPAVEEGIAAGSTKEAAK